MGGTGGRPSRRLATGAGRPFANIGRRVANPPQVANLPHNPALSVTASAFTLATGARHRSGREGSPNRSRDSKAALLALPIDLTLPYGRGSDWSTPYARILSIGRHLRKALTYCVAHLALLCRAPSPHGYGAAYACMSDTNGVRASRSPTFGLLTGMAVTLSAVIVYPVYTIDQLRGLRQLQAQTIDRNRTDSLLLLRIQNDLNSVALSIRDMLDAIEPYPLSAWQGQLRRIRADLEDAMKREEASSPASRTAAQRGYLSSSMAQFWDALDRIFDLARSGGEKEAHAQIRLSLQARQAALRSTEIGRAYV